MSDGSSAHSADGGEHEDFWQKAINLDYNLELDCTPAAAIGVAIRMAAPAVAEGGGGGSSTALGEGGQGGVSEGEGVGGGAKLADSLEPEGAGGKRKRES